MIKWIGSKYGGWHIDTALVNANDYVISAGLGNDISFDMEMIRHCNCKVVGIDPTGLTVKTVKKINNPNFIYIKAGLYYHDDGFKMSNETTNGNTMFSKKVKIMPTISIPTLLNKYYPVSVLKMNIEGAEYEVLKYLSRNIDIGQLCIRFHHRKPNVPYNYSNTIAAIDMLKENGYVVRYASDPKNKNVDYEVLLCKR